MDNIRDFQKAGAVAFGVGSALVPASQGVTVEELEALRKRAAGYVGVIG
jgi:2-dehydro-3-deoxyphosphogluconate aldolase/(4S)-4-hydroxy-2-oxoglutarate aldolase